MRVLISIFIILLTICFAIKKEQIDGKDAYTLAIPKEGDDIHKICKKIKLCLDADLKTVKWRRSFITAAIATFLICILVLAKIPTLKDLLLCLFIIYIVYYIAWEHYTNITTKTISGIGYDNLGKIMKKYKEHGNL